MEITPGDLLEFILLVVRPTCLGRCFRSLARTHGPGTAC